ncbi:GTP-dependent dephospho-CoA kinase family protein [Haladaptatus caseinilyticus]|uniref:GTP-dependent dephospho-CoA kinase family protein n=1 Tax=Haladaptatus caseinilyticus TaxID=2993314 RepID=UPI00224AC370|nr:GTP-dependent dephospho-CoA kinase family protein [Haladaptatus caseinilyticus]
MADTVVSLPRALRSELKEPLGPIFTDAETLLDSAGSPLVAVGDVVTYHLESAGVTPNVALVDGLTKRDTVEPKIRNAVSDDARHVTVTNPAGVLTDALLSALTDAIAAPEATVLVVDGEEDLAALPAVLAVPDGGTVVYGQPDEGMVLVDVTPSVKSHVSDLLARMDGDIDRLFSLVDYGRRS